MENFDAIDQVENSMDTERTIYVNNLPSELNEDGVRDIFSQYGQIIHMYYPRNATNAKWAYITYGTYREAEFAIRELNNRKPLCLKVSLAKSLAKDTPTIEKSQNLYVSQDFEEEMLATDIAPPFAHTDIKHRQSAGRGQSVNITRKHFPMSQITIPHADSELSSQASNIYEPEDHFENTNRLWTRGVVTVTSDGKRHVALGRGYTLYEFPEENPKIEEYIGKLYEKRLKGSYESGENKFKDRLQKCYTCSTKTTKHCEKCFTYYCSKSCQVKDWPRHQMECERIPALVEETVQNVSTLQIKEEEQEKDLVSKPNAVNKTIVSNNDNIKLRRPNTPQNTTNTQSNGTNISKTEKVDQLAQSNAVTKDSSQQNQRFKYNTAGNTDQSKRDEGHSTKFNSPRQNYNRNQNNVTNTSTNNNKDRVDNNDNVRDRNYTDKNQFFQRHEFQNDRKFSPHKDKQNVQRKSSASSNSNTDDDLAFHKDAYLSNKEFTEIEIVVPLDNNEYWITKLKDTEARKQLMIQLQTVAAKSRNVKPIIGNIYGVLYEKIWHRAMVISLNPVMVHFIDFGNDEILQKDADIRDIDTIPKVSKFAKKIQLTPGTIEKYKNLQYGDKISVRMLSMNTDGTIIVEVQQQLEDLLKVCAKESAPQSDTSNAMEKTVSQEKFKIPPIISIKASKIQIPNVLEAFAKLKTEKAVTELKFDGLIQIVESTQMNVYNATLCPEVYSEDMVMIMQDLQLECEKMKKSMNCRPQVEDLVCGKGEDGWYRGYVLTSSDLRIITVDEAKILPVDEILPCPENFFNICAFGVVCKMDHPIKLDVGQVYFFSTTMTPENCKQGSLKIDITVDDEVTTSVIKPWESLITKSTPALAELESGSKICLTSYRNQYIMFARSLNESEVEYYNDTMQRIAQCAQSAPNLSEPPSTGQIVIAPFCDGNNYRAMVMEVKDDKAKIAYIDFGNIDYVSIKELKVLPEDLARQRSCSAKIVLKDVTRDAPMTRDTDQYLRNLTGKEVPLTCVYKGSPSTDGVHLTIPPGESVNNKLNQLLIPNWKQKTDDEHYMLSDMKIADLGCVGDTIMAAVTYTQKVGKQYMLSPVDVDVWKHFEDVMTPMMKEYCEKTEHYIPKVQELCLALYEGVWYRGACLDKPDSDTPDLTCQIFFLDYGNIDLVKHQDIRRMSRDFTTPAAMANLCTVVNLAPLDNAGNYSPTVQQKIEKLVPDESNLVKIKIIEKIENGDYKVEFPDVHAKLV